MIHCHHFYRFIIQTSTPMVAFALTFWRNNGALHSLYRRFSSPFPLSSLILTPMIPLSLRSLTSTRTSAAGTRRQREHGPKSMQWADTVKFIVIFCGCDPLNFSLFVYKELVVCNAMEVENQKPFLVCGLIIMLVRKRRIKLCFKFLQFSLVKFFWQLSNLMFLLYFTCHIVCYIWYIYEVLSSSHENTVTIN